jgi:thioredoxin-dependent peroxiredoxin
VESEIVTRAGAITMYGKPLTLLGPALAPGDLAPRPPLTANDLSTVVLGDAWGRPRVINCVPSIDTPVCDKQTRHFDKLASELERPVELVTVSVDLPFAQRRYIKEHGLTHQLLSDYRETLFGLAYGVLIKELRLLARAVFVVDPGGKLVYVEYVRELATEPDYKAALAAAASVA